MTRATGQVGPTAPALEGGAGRPAALRRSPAPSPDDVRADDRARHRAARFRALNLHASVFAVTGPALFLANVASRDQMLRGYGSQMGGGGWWFLWPVFIWAAVLGLHAGLVLSYAARRPLG